MKLITLENAHVSGLTVSGAILLDSQEQGYRIEIGQDGMEYLAHLLGLMLKDRSKLQRCEESSPK